MSEVTVSVRVALVDCWSCGAEYRIVPSIAVASGHAFVECSVADFSAFPRLITAVQDSLPIGLEVGAIKRRYSCTLERSYVSNGCFHCDALHGRSYEIHARYDEELAAEFIGEPAAPWLAMVAALEASEDGHLD
jgi:competence protein CoiA